MARAIVTSRPEGRAVQEPLRLTGVPALALKSFTLTGCCRVLRRPKRRLVSLVLPARLPAGVPAHRPIRQQLSGLP
jgi:hypothetical protein